MDNFYKYKISYYSGFDEIEEDSGIVFSPEGSLSDAVAKVSLDYCGNQPEDIVSISVSCMYEEGKFTLAKESIKSFIKEEENGG